MIGIVVVSHSAMLAAGLKALADQLGSPAKLLLAAGVDDPAHPIGTDAIAVMSAMEEADDGSGVLVLMDLGSALLSAETALELLPPELSARVRLSPAPLVEGTLAAVVAAGAADRGEQCHAGGFQHLTYVFVRHRGQLLGHLGEAALHVEAVVAVTDVGIQRREVVTLLGKDMLAVEQPIDDLMFA